MPKVCYYKYARERPFTESDAARVCCYAIANGATMAGIRAKVQERGCVLPGDCDCDQTNSIISTVLEILAAISIVLGTAYTILRAVGVSVEVYHLIRQQQGLDAAEAYAQLPSQAKALEDMGAEVQPWLEMSYNPTTGLWEKVPEIVPIIIKP